MTLHDLSNGTDIESLKEKLHNNKGQVQDIFASGCVKPYYIRMKSNYAINMVNTSIVLCLYPVDEANYKRIMELYSLFDKVVSLPYPFTPHITLAYFNRNGFDVEDVSKLEEAVNYLNLGDLFITLRTDKLFYQWFNSMNDFRTITRK